MVWQVCRYEVPPAFAPKTPTAQAPFSPNSSYCTFYLVLSCGDFTSMNLSWFDREWSLAPYGPIGFWRFYKLNQKQCKAVARKMRSEAHLLPSQCLNSASGVTLPSHMSPCVLQHWYSWRQWLWRWFRGLWYPEPVTRSCSLLPDLRFKNHMAWAIPRSGFHGCWGRCWVDLRAPNPGGHSRLKVL